MRIHPISPAQTFYKEDSSKLIRPCSNTANTSTNGDKVVAELSFYHHVHGKELFSCGMVKLGLGTCLN